MLTLRGKDALNAITNVHQAFRTRHGQPGLGFLRALAEGLTPAEFALRDDGALHELEALVQEFVAGGFVREA
ncbi:hypothetical protein [Deinococcus multiflagellatus]|uniref:Uncharacterized protein n=1 Tax=Deinococcus multiflagellatus TaxID=1656887 RepID=A0ABW1ZFX8_9DEIO